MSLRCAYCHGEIAATGQSCPRCRTVLHVDCWAQAGRCPTLGCGPTPTPATPPSPRLPWSCSRCSLVLFLLFLLLLAWLWASRSSSSPLHWRRALGYRWELETRAVNAYELAFSADCSRLFASCGLGLRIADVSEGRWTHTPDLHYEPGLAVSPAGDRVAIGRSVWISEAVGPTPLATLPGRAAAWSPVGYAIACVESQGGVSLVGRDGLTVRRLALAPSPDSWALDHHSFPCASFSGDGSRLAAVTQSGVNVWDVASGTRLLTVGRELDPIRTVRLSRDGTSVAAVGSGGFVRWAVPSGQELAREKAGQVDVAAIAPDLETAAVYYFGRGATQLPILSMGRELELLPVRMYVQAVAFSPDGRWLAVSGTNTEVQLWKR